MIIQAYLEELNYVNAKLHPRAAECGSFLQAFLRACVAADSFNYELLRPCLHSCMAKYPADPELLAIEQREAG